MSQKRCQAGILVSQKITLYPRKRKQKLGVVGLKLSGQRL